MGDGAFSNVYKAVDKLSGQKVAGKFRRRLVCGIVADVRSFQSLVKVVRKYELSPSQVSLTSFFLPLSLGRSGKLSFEALVVDCCGAIYRSLSLFHISASSTCQNTSHAIRP